ncbi:MAG: hydroxyacylglutathione hydrolase [Pseudoalteromonas distincta]|tara:strand:+ start:29171 stop:29950 length:780 start_codon:yes stop_codon:yes gene_type:complete
MLEFIALPAFQDNYIWLILDTERHRAAVVDPGDAVPVITWLGRHPEYDLTHMLITHHHRDHTGGLATIKAATDCKVWGPAAEDIPGLDRKLEDGATLSLFDQPLRVISVPGHTRGHIAFFCDEPGSPWLLSGDTLFAGGCGRLFEGTAEQMHASLQRLAALPDDTRVYCAHEYTQANLRFARAVEPDNQDIKVRAEVVDDLRAAGRITLPSSIGLEKKTNPFLRPAVADVISAAALRTGQSSATEVETFAAIRAWKDSF